jgi:hypothetical protein
MGDLNKAARTDAHSASERLLVVRERRRARDTEIRTGPLALRACEQFPEMIQLQCIRFAAYLY